MIGDDLPTETAEVRDKRAGNPLRASTWNHPADQMCHDAEHEAEAGGQRLVERHHAVRRDAAEERPRALLAERASREAAGRTERAQPERRKRERMLRQSKRPQHGRFNLRPAPLESAKDPGVRLAITAERRRRPLDGSFDNSGRPVIERMRGLNRRINKFESVLL